MPVYVSFLFASPARMRREAAIEGKKMVSKNNDGMCCGKAQREKNMKENFRYRLVPPLGFVTAWVPLLVWVL